MVTSNNRIEKKMTESDDTLLTNSELSDIVSQGLNGIKLPVSPMSQQNKDLMNKIGQ